MEGYPVSFDVTRPEKFERAQVFLRLLVVVIVGIVGSVLWLLYLVPPVVAAIFISSKGGEKFLEEDGPRVTRWLRWFMAFDAYIRLIGDRFPTQAPEDMVQFDVRRSGSPTVGSALLRIIYSIPSGLVLLLFGIVAGITWIIAAVFVLIQESYPESLYKFHRAYVRWVARLLSYHFSLVEQYPPFAIDTGAEP